MLNEREQSQGEESDLGAREYAVNHISLLQTTDNTLVT